MTGTLPVERVSDVPLPRRQATAELIGAVRDLMTAAAVTEVDDGVLTTARALVTEASALLTAATRPRALRPDFEGPGEARAAGAGAAYPICQHNPLGLPVLIRFVEDGARGTLVPGALAEGPPDSLHGGWSAWLMDTMLGVLVQAQGRRAVTASLQLDYRNRVRLDERIDLGSRIASRDGRKTVVEGWIEQAGVRAVEARGLFVDLRNPS
ncbi:PaaI family thioesterase [Blastococcus sp. SYSU D00820]